MPDYGTETSCSYEDRYENECGGPVVAWRESTYNDGRVWVCQFHLEEEMPNGPRHNGTTHIYHFVTEPPTTNDNAVLLYLAARGKELIHG